VSRLDWIALAFVAVAALVGLRKGLIGSALSLIGILAGAVLGARIAPELLSGGSRSPYTPLVALAGACFGAIVLEAIATLAGQSLRRTLAATPLRLIDSAGGAVLGALAGLAIVWVVGAGAVLLPGRTDLRRSIQDSAVIRRLNEIVSPRRLLRTLARVDPFPAIAGPNAPVAPPDPRLLRSPAVVRAEPSVVRVLGIACGLAVEGSGWVARPGLVVTAAHVVAGEHTTTIQQAQGAVLDADVVAFDVRNDVAVLRIADLRARPLPLVDPVPGHAVAILGYPDNGPFTATPGRIGQTSFVLTRDAYGRGPVTRKITSIRGRIRHGNSGGPAVDATGAVETMVFASRVGSPSGYGVPADVVRRVLRDAKEPVSTGDCA
jgi:S1-C subfamily serine protease